MCTILESKFRIGYIPIMLRLKNHMKKNLLNFARLRLQCVAALLVHKITYIYTSYNHTLHIIKLIR